MKKTMCVLSITALMVGTMLTSCKSDTEKKEDAVENVNDANQNLDNVEAEADQEAMTKANDGEWQAYKAEANATIADNEIRIIALRKAMQKPGTAFDASYAKSIDALEEKNKALKTRIEDYEDNKTDWESFKRELKSDMDGLAKAFSDLTVNNKK